MTNSGQFQPEGRFPSSGPGKAATNVEPPPAGGRFDPGTLIGGVLLIGLGVLFLFDKFDVLDFRDLVRYYWPMTLILIGVPKLTRRRTFWPGLWMITLGTWLQIATLRVFGLTYRNSWPLLLIALGAGLILRTVVESMRPREDRHEG